MTTFAIIGDSQAGGLDRFLQAELMRLGWAPLGAQHRNGASTRVVIDELLPAVLRARPEVLFVAAGGNDLPAGTPEAWGELLRVARAGGVRRVVWIGPPAADAGYPDLDAIRRTISNAQRLFFATKPDVQWINGRTTASGLPRASDSYHVHLTADGYREWASRLARLATGGGVVATVGITGLVLWGGWKLVQWMTR